VYDAVRILVDVMTTSAYLDESFAVRLAVT
jgi:hypothetical protein